MSESNPDPLKPVESKHKRRVRYRGTHPRRFADKYKEHDPQRYADDVAKVLASGKTPAGSHRPICLDEIMEFFAPKPGQLAADATLGYGGHSLELARAIQPGGKLFAVDVDSIELPRTEARLLAAGIPRESLIVCRSNFAGLAQILAAEGVSGVDMVIADLGISSMQIDNPERGFSFKLDGPLDLRMNPERGHRASDLLAKISEAELVRLLEENSDEPNALVIAKHLCAVRGQRPIVTTKNLAQLIKDAVTTARRSKDEIELSVRRVFQALRIAVNDEFGALDAFLRNLPGCLKSSGRVAILTFHSGEDRRVKKSFQAGEQAGIYSSIANEVTRPGAEEVRANPRASSAKLRWAIRA